MKKYLFVITSSSGSDEKDWLQLNGYQRFNEWSCVIDDDSFLHIFNAFNNEDVYSGSIWQYENIAKEILKFAVGNNIAVLLHTQKTNPEQDEINHPLYDPLGCLRIALKKISPTYTDLIIIRGFSTQNEDYEEVILSFINGISDPEQKKATFKKMWDKIEGKSPEDIANKAREFRAKLLTPLVALDWITQWMGSTSEHNELNTKQLVNMKDEAIEAFHKQVSEMKKSAEFEWLLKFDEYTNIEKSIQNGAVIHEELKNYAQKIEGKIEQMQ